MLSKRLRKLVKVSLPRCIVIPKRTPLGFPFSWGMENKENQMKLSKRACRARILNETKHKCEN
jgi:hypothetical protein